MAERGSPSNDAAPGATGFMQRAVVRRRVRYLRRRRELALRDLGGFVFECYRLGEAREQLLAAKLAELAALEEELATLERALALREEVAVLREPGIASCPRCGTIHDSSASFCPTCGLARGRARHDRDRRALPAAGEDAELELEREEAAPQ